MTVTTLIWLLITIPIGAFFTGLGIYAWNRKKPMWFWSGSTVKESEISDIPAYNRANGIMWICYSTLFWIGAVMGLFQMDAAGVVLALGSLGGIPILVFVYKIIFRKYGKKSF